MNKKQLHAVYLAQRVKLFAEFGPITSALVPFEHHEAIRKWLSDNFAEFEREAETFAEKFSDKNAE